MRLPRFARNDRKGKVLAMTKEGRLRMTRSEGLKMTRRAFVALHWHWIDLGPEAV